MHRQHNPASPEAEPEGRHALDGIAELSPAYFGMVMATGIISLAAQLLEMPAVAQALFKLNIAVYAVLWILTVLRMLRHTRRFFGDMVDHLRGPGFFTTVAGTSVLGSQFVLLAADDRQPRAARTGFQEVPATGKESRAPQMIRPCGRRTDAGSAACAARSETKARRRRRIQLRQRLRDADISSSVSGERDDARRHHHAKVRGRQLGDPVECVAPLWLSLGRCRIMLPMQDDLPQLERTVI